LVEEVVEEEVEEGWEEEEARCSRWEEEVD
jgi:hypothetical protein